MTASRRVQLGLPMLLIFGPGCPADDATGGGDATGDSTGDETGAPLDAEPIDPFDGEGSDPPGDPDPNLVYRPPSTLGNGLVHDSRFDLQAGVAKIHATPAELEAGIDWSTFVPEHADKVRVGFRPTQVDAEIELIPAGNGLSLLHVRDRSVYVSDDDANYRTVTKTHVFSDLAAEQALSASGPSPRAAPRPTAIDSFAHSPSEFGVNIVWTYDNASVAWELVVGQTQADFEATMAALSGAGYRPIAVASRVRNGASEYAGIFVDDGVPAQDWQAMLGLDAMQLAQESQQAWADGYYPFRVGVQQGSDQRFDVLWLARSPGLKLELRNSLDEPLFIEQDRAWRAAGYYLESATTYLDHGVERFAGLWVRHEPYLRWTEGVPIDTNAPIYAARYQPFHDQTIQLMTIEGEAKAGEYFRPSSTLHIFEGPNLVLSRAYTYAPAIYPDTPLDAPMALASVSKSITAAAIVQEMNLEGLPLTSSYAGLVGINLPAMAPVTVLDVLRNLGGFRQDVTSYADHSLIDQSNWGSYPITGEMMFDYAVLGNHLDTPGNDTYWRASTYNTSQNTNALVYSNAGYTMLGELLRVRTGLSYAEYVRRLLLDPLNLGDEIYPDPGHLNAHSVPTKTGLRSYLLNRKHPYITQGCQVDAHCSYLACDVGDLGCAPPTCGPNGTCLGCDGDRPCQPGWTCMVGECVNLTIPFSGSEPAPTPIAGPNDGSPTWSANAGPLDNSAPATAALERYAGGAYIGGAGLAAGGWYADGESLGVLTRVIVQTAFLMPQAVAAQLWNPLWWNTNHDKGTGWSYGLGWYARGNWVAMAGGTTGSMALAAHNSAYDFTIVHLANVKGNGVADFMNPMMDGNGLWGTSLVGMQFPCMDDIATQQNECTGAAAAY